MSKDSKFTIKNTQIAGAINLTGLKAKLSKKPASEDAEKDEDKKSSSKSRVEKSDSAASKKPKATKPKKEDAALVDGKKSEEPVATLPSVEVKIAEVVVTKTPEVVVKEVESKELKEPAMPKHASEAEIFPDVPKVAELPKVAEQQKSAEQPRSPDQYRSQPPRAPYPPRNDSSSYQDRRPPYPERKPYSGDRPAYSGDRPQGSRPPYSGDRPQGSRPPYSGDRSQGSRPPYSGDRPVYNRPFQPGQRYAGGSQSRPPYGDRGQGFAQKPFSSLPGSSPQPQRPAYPPRPQGFRPPSGAGQQNYAGPSQKPVSKELPVKERPSKFEEKKPADAFKQTRGKGKEIRKDEKGYDSRVRHGLVSVDDGEIWRKKRHSKQFHHYDQPEIVRPTKIKVRLPITIKELAVEMKLKASELIAKLFLQGLIVTLNDILDDELAIQLLGHDFGCEITIDTSEKERIQITDKTIRDEIGQDNQELLLPRPPVVAFMGHVDHGKTSLIDAIRKSNRASKEVGAITQHIGAFQCVTSHGPITILDTPGHEAFTLMRERGAEITDIVVLVIAGDEGIQEQTVEALNQARAAKATIVVALTKCDKPNFNADNVMRQMADRELLPEAWGGQTVTISCSAVSGQGIPELLEMLALQSEVLELKANPNTRARGTVIESQVVQGLGDCATVLVQNGTLREGDALVFAAAWAKIKRMRDDSGKVVESATPSTPVIINGLSSLPEAGEEFIVVKSEKEAKEIAETRQEGKRQSSFLLKKRSSVENLMQTASNQKKILRVVVRADVQGSLEALKKALERIKSTKAEIDFISQSVGQISESDVQLAGASKSVILGFHTNIESHAEPLIKDLKVDVRLHDIIYHAVDDIKALMKALLDKIAQEQERGKAEVKALFKSSQLGMIAGCIVVEGSIARNCQVRIRRDGQVVWQGAIQSLRRGKDDVKEVQKGIECGIFLQGFNQLKEGDVLEAFEVTYLEQEL